MVLEFPDVLEILGIPGSQDWVPHFYHVVQGSWKSRDPRTGSHFSTIPFYIAK